MKYYPKTQQKLKSTTKEDNFIYSDTKEKYTGFYILTADGSYFSGKTLEISSRQLEKPRSSKTSYNIGSSNNVIKHTLIKSKIYQNLSLIKSIPSSKPRPTKADYELGYFNRYFIKRINQDFGYKEISKKTFKDMKVSSQKYDTFLYVSFVIKWDLGEDAIIKNRKNIKNTEKYNEHLNVVNLLLFLTILNQYQKPNLKIKENLTTKGGELYNIGGIEYIGEYHIHPSKGPMVGSKHIKTSHDKLYYQNQTTEQSNIDEDFDNYLEKQKRNQKFKPTRPSVSEDIRTTKSVTPSRGGSTPNRGSSTPNSGRSGY